MSNVLILSPYAFSGLASTRGSGDKNLATRSPKEVWQDNAVGSEAAIHIDLGAVMPVDTVYLGYVYPPAAGAVWSITSGANADVALKASGPLRAIDSATRAPARTHALWTGDVANVRYLQVRVTQPAGSAPLSAGILMVGKAWRPQFNMELGHGRRVLDMGTVSQLPDGGFVTLDGARKRSFSWTLGDLSISETDALEELLLDHGQTVPLLVCEDPAASVGQRNRIHYGLFTNLKSYERADPAQTKWSFEFEEWI